MYAAIYSPLHHIDRIFYKFCLPVISCNFAPIEVIDCIKGIQKLIGLAWLEWVMNIECGEEDGLVCFTDTYMYTCMHTLVEHLWGIDTKG